MPSKGRWDDCVSLRGNAATAFFEMSLSDSGRRVLLIGGAGFDPRSRHVSEMLADVCNDRLSVLLMKEERPDPPSDLEAKAQRNVELLQKKVQDLEVHSVSIFARDGAVTGGRASARRLNKVPIDDYTDIIVDCSALSVGVAFPTVRFLLAKLAAGKCACNLHLAIVDSPPTDVSIRATATDRPSCIEGYRDSFNLSTMVDAAKLWIPGLREGYSEVLQRISNFVEPHTVCPVLPFPSEDPKRGDRLLGEYRAEIESSWGTTSRQLIYASESEPLNLYRTILRVDDVRSRVFRDFGGSQIILTPSGSKMLNIGAMLAAIERDFPVVYVESVGYHIDSVSVLAPGRPPEISTLWLYGSVYP